MSLLNYFKSLFSVASSRYILILLTLLSSIYIARSLGPERQGELLQILFLPQIIASLISLNIPEQLLCYWSSNDSKLKSSRSVILFSVIFYAFTLILLFLLILDGSWLIFVFSILYSLGIILNNFITIAGRAFDLDKVINLSIVTQGVVLLLLTIIIVNFNFDEKILTLAYLLSIYAPVFIAIKALIRSVNSMDKGEIGVVPFIKQAVIAHLSKLSLIVESSFDRMFIMKFSDPSSLGLYSVAQNLSQLVSMAVQLPLSATILPYLNSISLEKRWIGTLRIYGVIQFIVLIFSVGFISFSNSIINILYGESYATIELTLDLLIIAVCFRMPTLCLNYYLRSIFKAKEILKASLISMPVNIILCVILIPLYGIVGAGISSLVSYILYACFSLYVFYKNKQL
ncbi:hypothetical protein FCV87_18225 [Vibrio breoganii]|uniref:polysaccharide biosynthesis C-terminal domain-containing protein n=1 Tax=Vibrio breoganii TaxID=553239 RepID=UPI0010BE00CF|nr:polysaccharide biosynthesis C-terminal domain-containing protein [Vibrio breoganii]TKG24512.1 hypothetical protein FCV87_18225 [Vibrio breoganii]